MWRGKSDLLSWVVAAAVAAALAVILVALRTRACTIAALAGGRERTPALRWCEEPEVVLALV